MTRSILVLLFVCIALCSHSQEFRTIEGTGNNAQNQEWGAVHSRLLTKTTNGFADGFSAPAGPDRPNPRKISNVIFSQDNNEPNSLILSDYLWVFGQFIDHDITFVENSSLGRDIIPVEIPDDDLHFVPTSQDPRSLIFMSRSENMEGTGTSVGNPRAFANGVTAFIDGSAIYGSTEETASWLRTYSQGKLKSSSKDLLPWNTVTNELGGALDPNAPTMEDGNTGTKTLMIAGDVRANENPLLATLHVIFMREHNRMCDVILENDPSLSDEEVYLTARKYVAAYLQSIVYYEWLPAMGISLPDYAGYNATMNPGVSNVFSAAAFRMGHTLINSNIIRMENNGEISDAGNLQLRDAFFQSSKLLLSDVDPFLKGMATQAHQEMDCKVIDDIRNFLFVPRVPQAGGFDLAAININRGRERGLPDYNTIRANFGLPTVNDFHDITQDADEAAEMEALYGSVDNIDPWVGMLAEHHMPNALFGELIMTIMEQQFQSLRDGDRFYFENDPYFSSDDLAMIKDLKFHDIIMRNTKIEVMQVNVFEAMPHADIPTGPELPTDQLASVIYPNPTEAEIGIKTYLEADAPVQISLYDPHGRMIFTEEVQMYRGENFKAYAFRSDAPKGIYHVVLETLFDKQSMQVFKN